MPDERRAKLEEVVTACQALKLKGVLKDAGARTGQDQEGEKNVPPADQLAQPNLMNKEGLPASPFSSAMLNR